MNTEQFPPAVAGLLAAATDILQWCQEVGGDFSLTFAPRRRRFPWLAAVEWTPDGGDRQRREVRGREPAAVVARLAAAIAELLPEPEGNDA